jgi:hypothetical protein
VKQHQPAAAGQLEQDACGVAADGLTDEQSACGSSNWTAGAGRMLVWQKSRWAHERSSSNCNAGNNTAGAGRSM